MTQTFISRASVSSHLKTDVEVMLHVIQTAVENNSKAIAQHRQHGFTNDEGHEHYPNATVIKAMKQNLQWHWDGDVMNIVLTTEITF